jgi:hypothetical protein
MLENKKGFSMRSLSESDPGRIRTPNPQSRNLIFYPVELRGHLKLLSSHSLPAPDFKNFSLLRASDRFENRSVCTTIQGAKAFVERLAPLLCSLHRLSKFEVIPTHLREADGLNETYTKNKI